MDPERQKRNSRAMRNLDQRSQKLRILPEFARQIAQEKLTTFGLFYFRDYDNLLVIRSNELPATITGWRVNIADPIGVNSKKRSCVYFANAFVINITGLDKKGK